MFTLGGLTFLSPVLLGMVAVVPVLWWLLRVMPPRPKSIRFPAYFLIRDITTEVKTAAHTPWWLLLLRSLIVIFFIVALADPVSKLAAGLPGKGPVIIAVDDGWSAAANWPQRQAKMKEFATLLRREKRTAVFVPTAPGAQDGKIHAFGPMDADGAEDWIDHLKPNPWPRDAAGAAKSAEDEIARVHPDGAVYVSDGTVDDGDETEKLTKTLLSTGRLTVVSDDQVNAPVIVRREEGTPGQLAFSVEILAPKDKDETLTLTAYGTEGNALDNYKVLIPAGQTKVNFKWDILSEVRNNIARFALNAPQMASSVILTDSQWRQHPAGIVADAARKDNAGFLNEVYYLRRALEVAGAPEIGEPSELLKKQLSAVIWPDSAALTAADRAQLQKWVEDGGFLVRFAGPNLAADTDDPVLPVRLRYGERSMQGAMTWEKPARLGQIPRQSPFFGLEVPADVTVARQLLAEPSPEVFERTWLQLEDGTPLVTGGAVGKGFVVLVHTTAGPDWSDFCYSGLYVQALQRMIALSSGIGEYKSEAVLPPLMVLDGLGRLQPPERKSVITAVDPQQGFRPSPATPPGLYGDDRQFQVYNLGDALPGMKTLVRVPVEADVVGYKLSGEKSLKPDFLKIALWLLLIDVIATLWLRGAFSLPAPGVAAAVVIALVLQAAPAAAQDAADPSDLVSGIYLAYVRTGDSDLDRVSAKGLAVLSEQINLRTTIKVKGVAGVDPETDALYYYPFLYWPMAQAEPALSVKAARNIQNYLSRGGMVLFDTRDQQFSSPGGGAAAGIGTRKLRDITRNLQVPELMRIESGHILTKSFYLMDSFPGLYAGGDLWGEKEPSLGNDSVTSILIGGNDWAAAWSRDSRFIVSPGGEQQREMAYRFGVNLAMVALAGNYKSDQVHVPYILERMHRQ